MCKAWGWAGLRTVGGNCNEIQAAGFSDGSEAGEMLGQQEEAERPTVLCAILGMILSPSQQVVEERSDPFRFYFEKPTCLLG